MPKPLQVTALGIAIDVPVPSGADLDRLKHQWVRALRPPKTPPLHVIAGETLPTFDPNHPDHWEYRLTTQVTLAALRATQGRRLNFHAAALSEDDQVLGLVAASGTGKTTAATTLGRDWGYVSDETLSVAPTSWQVFAHPKPLSVMPDPELRTQKNQVSPDELNLGPTPSAATLRRLVLLHRHHDGSETKLEQVPLPEALVLLMPQISSLQQLANPLMCLSELLSHCGGLYRLHYQEIGDHGGLLKQLLHSPTHPPQSSVLPVPTPNLLPRADPHLADPHLDPTLAEGPQRAPTSDVSATDWWQRSQYVDAVVIEDDVVVLTATSGYHLTTIASVVWLAAATPQNLANLVDAAEAALGTHPDAADLVWQAIEVLATTGLIVRLGPEPNA